MTSPGRRTDPGQAVRAGAPSCELVACLSRPEAIDERGPDPTGGAGWLQARVDRMGGVVAADWLHDRHPRRLIHSLRTRAAGGEADPSDPARPDLLREAAGAFDLVELEAPHDLTPEVLAAIPPARRLVGWRGPAEPYRSLAARLRRLREIEAACYRIVVEPSGACDGLPTLELLRDDRGRGDLVAYADGEDGLWSRVLSAALGSPFVFGAVGDDDPREPSVERLVADYGLPGIGRVGTLFGLAGDPSAHSLSPRLHNAAYRQLGLPALFLAFRVANFSSFWDGLVANGALGRFGMPLRGLTVASPNKGAAAALASAVSPAAARSDSVNLLSLRHGHWVADTTDPAGVLGPLARRGLAVAGLRAAVVGCGGSGRAIASAMARARARVVLANRGRPRGEGASRRLGLPFVSLREFAVADFDLIVNATPVGRSGGELPFDVGGIVPGTIVVDLVYARGSTNLAVAARAAGATVVEGPEVLLVQAGRQFARMTGRAMPLDLAAATLGLPSGHDFHKHPPLSGRGRHASRLISPVGDLLP